MANQPSYDWNKLFQMAANKTPEEMLSSLSPEQASQVQAIMNDKAMTEKIMKSKKAQELLNKFKDSN